MSMLVALAVGVSASAASATTLFEWKVKGAALKSGSSKEFTLKSKELVRLNFTTFGDAIKLTSSNVKVVAENKPSVAGGKPGKLEKVRLWFENVQVEKPKFCTIKTGRIITSELNGELVEKAEAKKGTGVVELLLETIPSGLGEWATFGFEGENCVPKELEHNEFRLKGSVVAELSPQKAEATVGKLLLGKTSTEYPYTSEYVNSAGEFKTAGMKVALEPAILIGEPEMELVSKEAFGGF
ncbi:MAG TPA: hypothetical protein VK790_01110 [Solirubrobacteraceae bacterium]|nr:hypothetical protein [Solirubrobacteraceae bacterium]